MRKGDVKEGSGVGEEEEEKEQVRGCKKKRN
jgi:hypothetical protein